jgi:signal transduction histidine kinase
MDPDIDKLLRLPPDGSPPVLTRVRLKTVISVVCGQMRALLTATDGRIECSDNLHVALGNRLLLGQVFSNVVSNALIHTYPGRAPVVRIGATATREIVEVSVADNGAGIAPENLEHIFRPRWRVRGASERLCAGLAIVKRAVELQGGSVGIASIPGSGTTFVVRLARPPLRR